MYYKSFLPPPLVLTKDPAMTFLTTATTDQSSLTSTMGDQLLMIKQQSQELDELKENMNLVRQDLAQYQSSHMLMAQNLQALHSTVMEVAQAMTMMTSKLNQFHFSTSSININPTVSHTPQELNSQPSEASMGGLLK